ncbi:hypothetical protein [Longimicrobium sp.]|uniref:hypothetical protein n=1 Tax=Longimicrobium sp. TaxID=2029185 RepID=UPI003B3B47BF
MNYGRDYGNRNFLERAAHTVRGWMGRRPGDDDRYYDDEYRGAPMNRGWSGDSGYREVGDVSGGYGGGFDRGYGAANWRGYNQDWNRGGMEGRALGGGAAWGRGGGDEYRTGGYNPSHGSWDVDWDDDRSGGYDRGMNRGMGGGYSARGYGYGGGDDREHYMGRDFQTNHPHFGHHWQAGHHDDAMVDPNRGGTRDRMGGGMMGRGADRNTERYGGYDRGMRGGADRNYGGAGMLGGDADVGDVSGGMIGNYGAYGNYGIERFRSGSGGGVPTGQYFRGYGVGSGYRP